MRVTDDDGRTAVATLPVRIAAVNPDADGDGLSVSRRAAPGRITAKADTDGDGLGDGVDKLYETPRIYVEYFGE